MSHILSLRAKQNAASATVPAPVVDTRCGIECSPVAPADGPGSGHSAHLEPFLAGGQIFRSNSLLTSRLLRRTFAVVCTHGKARLARLHQVVAPPVSAELVRSQSPCAHTLFTELIQITFSKITALLSKRLLYAQRRVDAVADPDHAIADQLYTHKNQQKTSYMLLSTPTGIPAPHGASDTRP